MLTDKDLETPIADPTVEQEYQEYRARRAKLIEKMTEEFMIKHGLYTKDNNGNIVFNDELKKRYMEDIDNHAPFMIGLE